jgi:asparagine synthetase B (glutamine-hydrolysing)
MQGFLIICSKKHPTTANIPEKLGKALSVSTENGRLDLYTLPALKTPAGTEGKYDYKSDHFSLSCSADGFKVATDLVGSRTIWHYQDADRIIVATRQSFINKVIGSFELNEQAWVWMLSTGATGPQHAWDKRIKALRSDETLVFSMPAWKLDFSKNRWSFQYDRKTPDSVFASRFADLMEEVATSGIPAENSLVTLSGGYDSRAVTWMVKRQGREPVNTASWGVTGTFENSLTDAGIARKISKIWNTKHHEFNVELSTDFEKTFQKYLTHGDGRNEHMNSFMDGLRMWETVQEKGFTTVYRGDEAFGWLPVSSSLDVITSVGYTQMSDFKNIPKAVTQALPEQLFPEYLGRLEKEPLEDWRDRLYQEYRMPYVIGPLQDVPLNFTDTRNPLFSEKLIRFVRQLPPHLRTSKSLYAEWVKKLLPNVPFATIASIPDANYIIMTPQVMEQILEEMNGTFSRNLFGSELVDFVTEAARSEGSTEKVPLNSSVKTRLFALLPLKLKKMIRNKVTGYSLPVSLLLLRMLIALRAIEMYTREYGKPNVC